jgi:hypothetical protein
MDSNTNGIISVVDLSWVMYAFRHALSNLSIPIVINGTEVLRPTGHVFGTVKFIKFIAKECSRRRPAGRRIP